VGHLFELRPPDYYNPKYKQWRIEDLPILPENWAYKSIDTAKDRADVVINLLREHSRDEVLIATDTGREGEYIARLCIQEADISDLSRFRRFWVSEALTADVILSGIQNAKPLTEYNALAAQGYAPARADWLAGMNLITGLQKEAYKRFGYTPKTNISSISNNSKTTTPSSRSANCPKARQKKNAAFTPEDIRLFLSGI
jgi:DNA topoisomerase-3